MVGNLSVRVKYDGGQGVVRGLDKEDSLEKLLTHTTESLKLPSHVELADLKLLSGFPPHPLDISDLSISISDSGVRSGDSLILQYSSVQDHKPPSPASLSSQKVFGGDSGQPVKKLKTDLTRPTLERKVVPADNSCLFTAINFCMSGEVVDSQHSSFMREIISNVVSQDAVKYSEAILGRSNPAYCAWIQGRDAWGGAIEVQILAEYFQVEIGVVDIMSGSITVFGEGASFPQRMYLLYDGIHYDSLQRGSDSAAVFPPGDSQVREAAKAAADSARAAHQFTNTTGFTLKCLVCGLRMKGEKEALQHANQSKHTNFSEV